MNYLKSMLLYRKFFLIILTLFLIFFSFVVSAETICGYKNEVEIEIKREGKLIKTFQSGIAETPQEHKQGLMNCQLLSKERGLFFLFDVPERRAFWMKDTQIPLSIIYFDMNMKINSIEYGKPFSMIPVYSKVSTVFVLEVNSYDSLNLKVGDQAFLRYY